MPKMDSKICSKLSIRASDYRGERTPWHATQRRFRAHAPFYPVCWTYNHPDRPDKPFKELTGAPVFIQEGELDGYDEPDTCQKLVDSLPEASRRLGWARTVAMAAHGPRTSGVRRAI
jgi:hypothetical protein